MDLRYRMRLTRQWMEILVPGGRGTDSLNGAWNKV